MYISLDLETTGFDAKKDKIIEFGAIKFDLEGNTETLSFLINPEIAIPPVVTHITGIKNEDCKDAPKIEDKLQEIQNFIGDLPIIGHNIQFDTGFLRENGIPLTNDEYDTCQLASIISPGHPSYSLEILSSIFELKHTDKHRALDDAIAAKELFIKLIEEYQALPQELMDEITKLGEKTDWAATTLLAHLKHKGGSPKTTQSPATEIKIAKLPENASLQNASLIETTPPYTNIIKSLIQSTDKDSYISVPNKLFEELLPQIPDSIAKIDLPKKYISIKRLELFKQQSHFQQYEFTALIKYMIWLTKTKTGHLSEVQFFGEEYSTINKINVNENFGDPKEDHFYRIAQEKEEESPAICTHQFIIEHKDKSNSLTIIDNDDFIKTIFHANSTFIKLDYLIAELKTIGTITNEQGQAITENLIGKATIIFGYINNLYEKYNDDNSYSPRALVTKELTSTNEWINIQDGIKALLETSKELGDINNEDTIIYLQHWKKSLEKLHAIFLSEKIEDNMAWIEQDKQENIIIQQAPYYLKDKIKEILDYYENFKIISEGINLNDNGQFTKNLMGLSPEEQFTDISPQKENIQIFLTEDAPTDDYNKAPIVNFLKEYIKKNKGNIAIIFNSIKQLEYYTLTLSDAFRETETNIVSQLTGSKSKISEKFAEDAENSVLLITPNTWIDFKHHDKIKSLILPKIPFDPPSDPYIVTNSTHYIDPFNDFQVPKATFALKRIINRLPENKPTELILLDARLIHKSYGKIILNHINTINRVEIVSLASLSR